MFVFVGRFVSINRKVLYQGLTYSALITYNLISVVRFTVKLSSGVYISKVAFRNILDYLRRGVVAQLIGALHRYRFPVGSSQMLQVTWGTLSLWQKWVPMYFLGHKVRPERRADGCSSPVCAGCQRRKPNIPSPFWVFMTSYMKAVPFAWLVTLETHSNSCYRSADKSLARPGRKQANVSVRMAWICFGALLCRTKKLDDSSRLDVVEIARIPDILPSLFPSWSG